MAVHWISSSLNRKFLLGTFSGLLLVSVIFLLLFLGLYRGQMERMRTDGAIQVSRLLQASLEEAMLLRNLASLESIVRKLGAQSGIAGVTIINRTGEARFSSHPDSKGQELDLGCGECGFDPARSRDSFSFFVENSSGGRILRSVNPVHNKVICAECHGPAEVNPVNGTLVVDFDAEPIEAHARETALLLVGSGVVAVLVTVIGGWWFMQRFVISPVLLLSSASRKLAGGELKARVRIGGRDELFHLGNSFNEMAANLQDSLQELQGRKVFLQGLVDAIPDGIRVIDGDYRIVLANRAYREQLASPEQDPVGMPCYRSSHNLQEPCVPTLVTCPLHEIRQDPQAVKVVHRHIRADGAPLAVEVYAAPLGSVDGVGGDQLIVESLRDLEKVVHFNHERKLTEIGRLASGVAHEIHNPLASVRIALDSVTRKRARGVLEVPEEITRFLQLVDEEIGQCLDVTERLLKLSIFAGREAHVVDMNRAAADTLSLLDWEAEEKKIEVVTDLSPQRVSILANESDLRMIVLNLAHNAFHAMPDGGRLSLRTRYREDVAEMIIEDNGVGIPADTIQYVFDPYFSRRADGVEGTGLGLSIVMALVKRYGGSITMDSEPGRGSQFRIEFPVPEAAGDDV